MKQVKKQSTQMDLFVAHLHQRLKEGVLITFVSVGSFLFLALVSYNSNDPGWSHTGSFDQVQNVAGRTGAWFSDILLSLFGCMAYLLPAAIVYGGSQLYLQRFAVKDTALLWMVRLFGLFVALMGACGLATFHAKAFAHYLPMSAGGILGQAMQATFVKVFNPIGSTLVLATAILIGVTFFTGFSWLKLVDKLGKYTLFILKRIKEGAIEVVKSNYVRLKGGVGNLKNEWIEAKAKQQEDELRLEAEKLANNVALAKDKNKDKDKTKDHDKLKDQALDKSATLSPIADFENERAPDNPFRLEPKLPVMLKPAVSSKSADSSGASIQLADEEELSFVSMVSEKANQVLDRFRPDAKKKEAESKTSKNQTVKNMTTQFEMDTENDGMNDTHREGVKAKEAASFVEPHQPSLSLLQTADQNIGSGFSDYELANLSKLVETRLAEFGVEVNVVGVLPGPVITRFEMELAAGVKVSKIVGLAKDLARSLLVISVRVVEVIPGKSVVGLEIPNVNRAIIRLREILASDPYQNSNSPLTIALGKDIAGVPIVADLAKMPHLLVAGTTGSGKSVGLNAMLLSILYKATPQDVKMILIDPKMLELAVYEGIPHLLAPVVTDMKDAANALKWCVAEMERRYQLMAAVGVRNLAGFNHKVVSAAENGQPIIDPFWKLNLDEEPPVLGKLPYIVVLIDEFADMIMVVGKKVEELIARIAQKARAAGIHLILATQRPSVDVITGLIKANIPSRISFQVSSRIDSRTILDQQGAEQLLGHGDMLYLPPGAGVPVRIHGCYVADDEVHKVVGDLKLSEPDYEESLVSSTSGGGSYSFDNEDGNERDELYDHAVALVVESRRASISNVQRRLKIGYNRAARIIEQMEEDGIVSPVQSNGSREVLAPGPRGD